LICKRELLSSKKHLYLFPEGTPDVSLTKT
jgi:hypothetical protein